MKTVKEN